MANGRSREMEPRPVIPQAHTAAGFVSSARENVAVAAELTEAAQVFYKRTHSRLKLNEDSAMGTNREIGPSSIERSPAIAKRFDHYRHGPVCLAGTPGGLHKRHPLFASGYPWYHPQ